MFKCYLRISLNEIVVEAHKIVSLFTRAFSCYCRELHISHRIGTEVSLARRKLASCNIILTSQMTPIYFTFIFIENIANKTDHNIDSNIRFVSDNRDQADQVIKKR